MNSTKNWDLFHIYHSHIDIGYTHPQEVIEEYHVQFVAQAIELVKRNGDKPAGERFRFTCEGFYQVEQFWREASDEQRADFLAAVRSGDIELTAFYFHLTELLDEGHLHDTIQPALAFATEHDLPLLSACSFDINGFSWAMADALYDAGVRYLCAQTHTHHGGYPFTKPMTAFYWETPKGNRILVWNGISYHRANLLGLIGGPNPRASDTVPGVEIPGGWEWVNVVDPSVAEERIPIVLEGLEKLDYPYGYFPLAGSAQYTDNSPVGDSHVKIIDEWNARHGDRVRIHNSTFTEFFRHIEATETEIPTFRGEWTDWWSDGSAATPRDTILFRHAQRTKRAIERLDPDHQSVSDAQLLAMSHALWMYAEHTYGFSDTRLWTVLYQQIFARKSGYAVAADELVGRGMIKVNKALGEYGYTPERPYRYQVANSHPTTHASIAKLMVEFWEVLDIRDGIEVVDDEGTVYPCQILGAPRGWQVWVPITLGPLEQRNLAIRAGSTVELRDEIDVPVGQFENDHYRLSWQVGKGITSWFDKASQAELLQGEEGLGAPVHQLFPGVQRGDVAAARERDNSRLAAGQPASEVTRERFPEVTTVGKCVAIRQVQSGPVATILELQYDVPGAVEAKLVVHLYRDLPQVELALRMLKTNELEPEGMYVALPVALKDGVWNLDKPGGPIRPGLDQLPGTCCDYYMIQEGVALCGPHSGIAISSPDAALVHVGALRLWTFSTQIEPTGPLYSWLTNNKWETNFMLFTGGGYEFRYTLECCPDYANPNTAIAACRTHALQPLVVRGG